jgi:hypothetical protein
LHACRRIDFTVVLEIVGPNNVRQVDWSMLELLILAAMVFAGYAGGSGWLTLAGATAMTIGSWWRKMQLLRQHPRVPFSTKMTTYLVVSVVLNFVFTVASYIAGQVLRRWLAG